MESKNVCFLVLAGIPNEERVETAAVISHLNGVPLSEFPSLSELEVEEAKKLIAAQIEIQNKRSVCGIKSA